MFSLPNLFIHFLYAFHSIVILVGWLVGIVVPGWSYCMPTLRVHYSVFHIETKKERINEFMWYVRRTRVDQVENDDDDIMNRARWDCAGSIRGIYSFIGGGAPTGEGVSLHFLILRKTRLFVALGSPLAASFRGNEIYLFFSVENRRSSFPSHGYEHRREGRQGGWMEGWSCLLDKHSRPLTKPPSYGLSRYRDGSLHIISLHDRRRSYFPYAHMDLFGASLCVPSSLRERRVRCKERK